MTNGEGAKGKGKGAGDEYRKGWAYGGYGGIKIFSLVEKLETTHVWFASGGRSDGWQSSSWKSWNSGKKRAWDEEPSSWASRKRAWDADASSWASKKPCRDYQKGWCQQGKYCKFAH